MTPEFVNGLFAVVGALVGSGFTALFSWVQYKKAQKRQEVSETRLSHLAEIVAVEAQLGQLPEALRFHGLSKEDLDEVGVTPQEFAYLLNSFTLGGTWHRILHPNRRTPFGVDHYRSRMCESSATRKAWPLVKKMMNPSEFVESIDSTIRKIEGKEGPNDAAARN